jgi:phosphotransferase system enzyme I (PtsP)
MLRRLRDVMAGGGSAQERLNATVQVIAANLVAEVCSIYIRRDGNILELCATQGLNQDALYRTRMAFGEGLVGFIAETGRSRAFAEAQSHPKFAYFPETGEEIYHSLLGVPIRRSERVVGVLVVQNSTPRHYLEEEIESLETLAMVLAEVLAERVVPGGISGNAIGRSDSHPARLAGTKIHGGLGIGRVLHHQPRIVIRRVVAEDVVAERARLDQALTRMHNSIDRLLSTDALADVGEHREVLETYLLLAQDKGWINRMREAVDSGLTAEAAVQKVRDDTRARMANIADSYLRERLADLEDIALRLLQTLASDGENAGTEAYAPEGDWILVARSMGPGELLDYDPSRLKGLALEEGSATAHVAIVARALDIPVIGRVAGLLGEAEPGDTMIVDADHGQVLLRPRSDALAQFEVAQTARAETRARYDAIRDLPAETLDGVRVSLQLNAGLLVDISQLDRTGADGIGLYRTEIPFLVRREYPNVDAQTQLYARILESAGGRPVTFRTLDAGGDKRLPSFAHDIEENPALGWRAIRIGLDHPALLRQQLRALFRASAGQDMRVMFPMISTLEEFRDARAMVDLERQRAFAHGAVLPTKIEVGAMVEVPSILWEIDRLAAEADFLSVGSNDLFQFIYAADRDSPRLARRYDPLTSPFLKILKQIATAADTQDCQLTLCGELAGRPIEALVLVALGYRNLSMNATSIGEIKATLRSRKINELAHFIDYLIEKNATDVRNRIITFLRDHP